MTRKELVNNVKELAIQNGILQKDEKMCTWCNRVAHWTSDDKNKLFACEDHMKMLFSSSGVAMRLDTSYNTQTNGRSRHFHGCH